ETRDSFGGLAERPRAHRFSDLPASARDIEHDGTQFAGGIAMALSLRGEEPRKCHPLGDHGIPSVFCCVAIVSTSSVLRFHIGQIAPCRPRRGRYCCACGTRRHTTTQIRDRRERETWAP